MPFPAPTFAREGEHDALPHAIISLVVVHRHGDRLTLLGPCDEPTFEAVGRSRGGGQRAGCPAHLDHRPAPLLHGLRELVRRPVQIVGEEMSQRNPLFSARCVLAHETMTVRQRIWILRLGVVTPHDDVAHPSRTHAETPRHLGPGALVIQEGERAKVFGGDARGLGQRHEAVGVGRIRHDQHPDVRGRRVVDRTAHGGEDARVGPYQILSRHALLPGKASHEYYDVGAVERDRWIGCADDVGQAREGAVHELHSRPLEGLNRLGNLEEAQLDGSLFEDAPGGEEG
mmetsp:Transcript_18812/g.45196  ORF Transcript_18812/g.45196 Transcript_18812/m.45196 type:complete len:286 (+) Transcript_18812:275-1132(+)